MAMLRSAVVLLAKRNAPTAGQLVVLQFRKIPDNDGFTLSKVSFAHTPNSPLAITRVKHRGDLPPLLPSVRELVAKARGVGGVFITRPMISVMDFGRMK